MSQPAPLPLPPPPAADAAGAARVLALANALRLEGRLDDALVLFEHVLALDPASGEAMRGTVTTLGAGGRTLEALHRLMAFKAMGPDIGSLLSLIRGQSLPAVAKFNAHVAAGQLHEAEQYAAALAALIPKGEPMLSAALSCNQALGRAEEAARYARALLDLDPAHPAALAALPSPDIQALVRLRDLHDASSAILCRTLTPEGAAEVEGLLAQARALTVNALDGTEVADWERHYRFLMDGVDLDAVQAATPAAPPRPPLEFATSAGKPMKGWPQAIARADKLDAKAVFFAAADETYVDLYARWYALSILNHCDVDCLVVIQVIGGAGRLAEIAGKVGVADERLIFAADGFDAGAVITRCYAAPPKGEASRPLAHFQSARFLTLGALVDAFQRPVFVSDIDLLLQRGVVDLLDRCAGADLALNENAGSPHAGSRITANLLLANPTANAAVFLDFLRDYLQRMLERPRVTRWVDQLGLLMARHHLDLHGDQPKVAYFDTSSDINNVMYPSYQEHPFRFLSLFHGFDTSSLEANPKVLGAASRPQRRKKRPASG